MGTQIQLTIFLNWKKRKITQITVKALSITWKAVTLAKVESNSWPMENAKDRLLFSKCHFVVFLNNLHLFSASNTFKLKANRRRSTVQVQGVKVYGNCCWKLVERQYRWEQDFIGGVESTINKYVYNGMKLEC